MPMVFDLCRLISREEAACRSLLETVQEERTAIRRLAITEFYPINCRRLAILESLQVLAQESNELVGRLIAGFGLPETTTLEDFIDRLTEPESADLRARHRSFIAIAKSVRAEIAQNAVLIEGIRGLVDQALSAGTTVVPGQDLYAADGQSSCAGRLNVLIHQRG
jgi:flagellar biosynthesis/type III secretory pathway chaperone